MKLATNAAFLFPAGPLSDSSWVCDPESPDFSQSDQKAQLQVVLGGGSAPVFGNVQRRS